MMCELLVEGGERLYGELTIQGSKNSVLPILAATLLCADTCVIENCPKLRDVDASVAILRHLGCCTHWEDSALVVDTARMDRAVVPDALMREMRSSVIFLGAILARCKEATICYPGGCELGPRPIDLHLSALSALGAEIRETGGELKCRGGTLLGSDVYLPMPSVGATENALLCACGADGVTTIYNAAREPEIVDLQNFINAMGGNVRGAGGSIITVEGKRALHGGKYRIIADRIVGATYLCAAACCGFPEVANNLILDGHTLGAVQAVITDNAWNKLTENQQAAGMEAAADTQAFNADLSETAENKVLDELKSSGCNVIDVPDKAPWQEACAKVISENTSDQAELYQQLLACTGRSGTGWPPSVHG